MASFKTIRRLLIAAVLAVPVALLPTAQAHAGVFISVGFAPPVLPVYAQPLCPGDGYIWTPGYWAYNEDGGYYWVPGVWVQPPTVGYLWTPAYWGWENGAYLFHGGYWGPHVGFYGGINYGFGYGGVGFEGGYWNHGAFFYNRSVANLGGVRVTNVYVRNVTIVNHSNVAFNGGHGGIEARPSAQEAQFAHEQHVEATHEQAEHQNFAAQNRSQFASVNHGRPGVSAAASPAAFHANPTGASHFGGNQNNAGVHNNTALAHPTPEARTQPEATQHTQAQARTQPAANTQSHAAPHANNQAHGEKR
ncbi:YXWGXW repeat-containing protein [Granulicella mallensis]|uniref:YXWGXW repeat-containing protein n=1 Tax=Granulicella mallensis (strain ATCC BAA-1857 / DSM 23137 / MP5ACTX8) TaxID=682795 RepID=G8NZS2_GRAMM|nr:YXWGXW repeat-containing protein [Granulicella mallensis]AEU34549.1 hypothetical protein AciX8_0191 [Granulicella mallensis MP5ACTX8]